MEDRNGTLPFTVLLHYADTVNDTFLAHVFAEDAANAIFWAKRQCLHSNYGEDICEKTFFSIEITLSEYVPLMVIEGHHQDLMPRE